MRAPRHSPSSGAPREPRAFTSGGYEILDSRLKDAGEIMLWSVGGVQPRCGELFTIQRDGAVCDLSVVQVTGHNPGWSALCRVAAA